MCDDDDDDDESFITFGGKSFIINGSNDFSLSVKWGGAQTFVPFYPCRVESAVHVRVTSHVLTGPGSRAAPCLRLIRPLYS